MPRLNGYNSGRDDRQRKADQAGGDAPIDVILAPMSLGPETVERS